MPCVAVVDPEIVVGWCICKNNQRDYFRPCPHDWNHAHIIATNEIETTERLENLVKPDFYRYKQVFFVGLAEGGT